MLLYFIVNPIIIHKLLAIINISVGVCYIGALAYTTL